MAAAAVTAALLPAGAAPARRPPDPAAAVRRLLARRALAVRRHDDAALLATVDPRDAALRAAQRTQLANLAAVPLASWSYRLVPAAHPRDGADRYTPTAVVLSYRLAGFDTSAALVAQHPTFVRRAGRWYVASLGPPTVPWDFGPVVVRRDAVALVLGHPGATALLDQLVGEVTRDIPRVTAVWGRWAERAVVVVPAGTSELAAVSGDNDGLAGVAALATSELPSASEPGPDRVYVNPGPFGGLSAIGRQVVITHELTHLAARSATGPATPDWLLEGFADYVGFAGSGLPVSLAAQELATAVHHGLALTALPADAAFTGGNADLPVAYEESWLACRMVAAQAGAASLVELYRRVGAARTRSAAAVGAAVQAVLHESLATFTARWRAYVLALLS